MLFTYSTGHMSTNDFSRTMTRNPSLTLTDGPDTPECANDTARPEIDKVEVQVWVNLEVHFQNGFWSKGGGRVAFRIHTERPVV